MLFDIKMISMKEKTKSIFNPKYQKLISEIIRLRNERGLTQRELAKLCGVSHCYIGRVETHERRLDLIETIDILKVLGVSKKEILKTIEKLI